MKSLRRVWDRSLPRPVGEEGRRSVGNGKERLRDYSVSRIGSPTSLLREAQSKNRSGAKGDNCDSSNAALDKCEFVIIHAYINSAPALISQGGFHIRLFAFDPHRLDLILFSL